MRVWFVYDGDGGVEAVFSDKAEAEKVMGHPLGDGFEVLESAGEKHHKLELRLTWDPGNTGGVGRGSYRPRSWEESEWSHVQWGFDLEGDPPPIDEERSSDLWLKEHPYGPTFLPRLCVLVNGFDHDAVRKRFAELAEAFKKDHPELVEGDPRQPAGAEL